MIQFIFQLTYVHQPPLTLLIVPRRLVRAGPLLMQVCAFYFIENVSID